MLRGHRMGEGCDPKWPPPETGRHRVLGHRQLLARSCRAHPVAGSTGLLKQTGCFWAVTPASPGIPRGKNFRGQRAQTRLGNSALGGWRKSPRGRSRLDWTAPQTTEGHERSRPLSPFPGERVGAPSPLRDTYLLPGLPFHHICTAGRWNIKMLAGGSGRTQGSGDRKSCCLPPAR